MRSCSCNMCLPANVHVYCIWLYYSITYFRSIVISLYCRVPVPTPHHTTQHKRNRKVVHCRTETSHSTMHDDMLSLCWSHIWYITAAAAAAAARTHRICAFVFK